MPRKVRDSSLEDATGRAKLKPRGKPYWRALTRRLHLGYRKGKTEGRWVARWYIGEQKYRVETLAGRVDDHEAADGVHVLNYEQAIEAARRLHSDATGGAGSSGPITVTAACEAYVAFLRAEKKTADDAVSRLAKHILPSLGGRIVTSLTQDDIEAVKRAMVRTDPDDQDAERRSKDNSNRVMSYFKAALNRAFRDPAKGIGSDAAWRKVVPFEKVARAREVHLDAAQSRRLINVTDGQFRKLVTAALLTGARPPEGELASCRVRDFRADLATLTINDSKTGPRDVVLTSEGVRFFQSITAGRDPDALLLPKDDGTPWGKNHHRRPMIEAIRKAKLPAGTCFYSLRHTCASQSILGGINLKLLAENMGTSIRMLETNYLKFINASRRKLVEKSAFRIGLRQSRKITPLSGGGNRARRTRA